MKPMARASDKHDAKAAADKRQIGATERHDGFRFGLLAGNDLDNFLFRSLANDGVHGSILKKRDLQRINSGFAIDRRDD